MRVIGIDPGSRITGYGVVDVSKRGLEYVECGCITTGSGALTARLKELYDGVAEVVSRHAPDSAAVEEVFMARNANSALKLGQARGVAIAALVAGGVPIHEYAARRVKLAVVGTGSASKAQIQHMTRVLLRLPGEPRTDAADALAIAICHVNTLGSRSEHT